MTPIPIAPSYEALNGMLSERCLARQCDRAGRRAETIGERLAADTAVIRTLPVTPLEPCEKWGSSGVVDGVGALSRQ
jgi:hypothetical protein